MFGGIDRIEKVGLNNMDKCSRIECENFSESENLKPCGKCKEAATTFLNEDWSFVTKNSAKEAKK